MARSNAALLIIAALAMGCQSAAPDVEAMPATSATAAAQASAAEPKVDEEALAWKRCRERIAEAKQAPVLKVTAITMRNNPIWQTALTGMPGLVRLS